MRRDSVCVAAASACDMACETTEEGGAVVVVGGGETAGVVGTGVGTGVGCTTPPGTSSGDGVVSWRGAAPT